MVGGVFFYINGFGLFRKKLNQEDSIPQG